VDEYGKDEMRTTEKQKQLKKHDKNKKSKEKSPVLYDRGEDG